MSEFEQEIQEVQRTLASVSGSLHPALRDFIQDEIDRRKGLDLARVVLAAAYPQKDTPALRMSRVDLAAALELLAVALGIHKVLLEEMDSSDSIERSLAGGTVLAGDYCFSRAAALAAQTERPDVVSVFSRLLQQLSEGNLRHIFEQDGEPFDEQELLYRSGAHAGSVLANLTETQCRQAMALATRLAHESVRTADGGSGWAEPSIAETMPDFQSERWQLLAP